MATCPLPVPGWPHAHRYPFAPRPDAVRRAETRWFRTWILEVSRRRSQSWGRTGSRRKRGHRPLSCPDLGPEGGVDSRESAWGKPTGPGRGRGGVAFLTVDQGGAHQGGQARGYEPEYCHQKPKDIDRAQGDVAGHGPDSDRRNEHRREEEHDPMTETQTVSTRGVPGPEPERPSSRGPAGRPAELMEEQKTVLGNNEDGFEIQNLTVFVSDASWCLRGGPGEGPPSPSPVRQDRETEPARGNGDVKSRRSSLP